MFVCSVVIRLVFYLFFFFKQKTAYEMRISDWSSDVCSSDLEFGIGTLSLVAMGCIMVRQCHSNTCPVGVCTQDEKLRQKFTGSPEKVINLMTFIAEEVREILAKLGVTSLDEVIGRTELLRQVSRGAEHLDDLDLNPILAKEIGRAHV